MRHLRPFACAAVALAAAGCIRESTIEPIRETVMMHGMLRAGSGTVGVAIGRVSADGSQAPVNGASVTLERAGATTTLIQTTTSSSFCFVPGSSTGAQCYGALLASPVEPGETIALTVELADGARIVGRTTVPLPPAIEEPADSPVEIDFEIHALDHGGFNVEQEPLEVRWSGTGSRPADVALDIGAIFDDGTEFDCSEFQNRPLHSRSPAYVSPPPFCAGNVNDMVWDSAHVTLHVVAYDDNALDYLAAIDDVGAGIVLDGASPGLDLIQGDVLLSGVFGSAASTISPLTLVSVVVDE